MPSPRNTEEAHPSPRRGWEKACDDGRKSRDFDPEGRRVGDERAGELAMGPLKFGSPSRPGIRSIEGPQICSGSRRSPKSTDPGKNRNDKRGSPIGLPPRRLSRLAEV